MSRDIYMMPAVAFAIKFNLPYAIARRAVKSIFFGLIYGG